MARLPRPIDDGLIYHARNRGNNRADVFTDDGHRQAFLDTLGQTQARSPFKLLGYCLLTNHFHLLVRPEPGQSISRIFQSLTLVHTWRYPKRHRSSGHVWQGRFKSPAVPCEGYLLSCGRSIERNPLEAGLVTEPWLYAWSTVPRAVDPLGYFTEKVSTEGN